MPGGAFSPTIQQDFAAPFGYGPAGQGVGAVVTQITNRTTAVSINALCGAITTHCEIAFKDCQAVNGDSGVGWLMKPNYRSRK